MQMVSTSKVLAAAAAMLLTLGAVAGCSGSSGDTDEPVPVGGINGPARVNTDSGSADNGGQAD